MCVHLLGLSELTQTHTIKSLVQLHILLVKSPVSSCFHANLKTCFGHTGPLSGIYDDLRKLLYCTTVEQRPRRVYCGNLPKSNRQPNSHSQTDNPTPTIQQTTQLLQSNRQLNSHNVESAGDIYTSQFATCLLGHPHKRYPINAHNRSSIANRSASRLASRV
jgi:hypothetical protein